MGNNNKVKHLQSLFLQYSDSIRNVELSIEHNFFSPFSALLALRQFPESEFSFDHNSSVHMLETIINRFHDILLENNYINRPVVPPPITNHPALHNLLYTAQNLTLGEEDLLQLLDWGVNRFGPDLAAMATPQDIAQLMVEIAGIEEGANILDPSMGTAHLITAAKQKGLSDIKITGVELNAKAYYISSLYKYLLNGVDINVIHGNAFAFSDELIRNSPNVILCNPPIKRMPIAEAVGRYGHQFNSDYISTEHSVNFIELSLKSLSAGGRAVFLIHMSPLFMEGDLTRIRKHWVDDCLLEAVISLPSKLLSHTGLKCAILVFSKPENRDNDASKQVKFIKAEDCYVDIRKGKNIISDENKDEILRRIQSVDDGVVAKNIAISEIADNKYNIVPDLYLDQQIGCVNLSLSKIWKPLGELSQVIHGRGLSKLPDGETPIIQGRDLRTHKLKFEELDSKDLSEYKQKLHRAQKNDILIQRIGKDPAAYLVTEDEDGYVVADTVYIIRFHDIEPNLIQFIAQFLNSDEGAKRINNASSYSVVQTQSIKRIKEIEVPVPDAAVVSLVKEMNDIESSLRLEYEKAAQLRKSIFGGFDEGDLSTNFNKIRFTSRALENALSQKDDIHYKIRNYYPFPIAFPYRNIYVEREYSSIYDRQMKYGEHLLSFLASVGLSLVFEFRSQLEETCNDLIEIIQSALSSGISPGHWRQILQKTCSLLKNLDNNPIAADFSSVWYKGRGKKESDFAIATEKHLVCKLNDFKHGRGPVNTQEYKLAGEKQKGIISNLLDELVFFLQSEIVLIDDLDTDWASKQPTFYASLLKGDHPAFEQIKFTTTKSLSKEKLYLRYEDEYICLYPFLSFQYNDKTKRSEIFSFDKIIKNKKLQLKSFDSGTSIEAAHIKQDLECWYNKMM